MAQTVGDSVERVRVLGRLAMCYTVGVIVGPALGGWLSSGGDLYVGARLAVILSGLALILSACISTSSSPASTTNAKSTGSPTSGDLTGRYPAMTQTSQTWGHVAAKLASVLRAVWPLLLVKTLISFANSLSDATRPIVLKNEFYFDHAYLGYFMSLSSCVSAISDGALTGPLVTILGSELSRVQASCIAILVGLYIAQAAFTSASFGTLWVNGSYYGTLISYASTYFVILVFRHILSSTVTGLATGRVRPDEKGTLLGLENALYAAARVGGPLVGMRLYTVGRASLVAVGSAAVFGVCHCVWSRLRSTTGKIPTSVPAATATSYSGDDEDCFDSDGEEESCSQGIQKTNDLRL